MEYRHHPYRFRPEIKNHPLGWFYLCFAVAIATAFVA